ncbi:MAG: hypothetical protein PHZ25_00955 [Candidatus Pacebacteria bacterium]|nr:hypothetical protein [Candidatus Paceibacterota bacterium]
MFAIIEVKNGEFEERTIESRFILTEEAEVNNNKELAAIIETGSGEISFLAEKLKKKKFFFFFPFKNDFGSCMFFQPENFENAEGGFKRGCQNISSLIIFPKKTRLGIFFGEGRVEELVILEAREKISLLG